MNNVISQQNKDSNGKIPSGEKTLEQFNLLGENINNLVKQINNYKSQENSQYLVSQNDPIAKSLEAIESDYSLKPLTERYPKYKQILEKMVADRK